MVATLTMTRLIANHQKHIIESKLKHFYSTIGQAVILAENEYGDKRLWWQDLRGAELDEDGNMVIEASEAERWFMKYVGKNLNIIDKKFINGGIGWGNANGIFVVYFADGSAFGQMHNHTTRDWVFYPGNPEKCIKKHGSLYNALGKCAFAFNFVPNSNNEYWKYHNNKGFEPWKFDWDGNQNSLQTLCDAGGLFCTALIQMNDWTIPKNYPKKFHQ